MKDTALIIMALIALGMGIYACWPTPKQANQVNIPLYSVYEQQQELVARRHTIKIDGKHGKNTDLALTIELAGGEK